MYAYASVYVYVYVRTYVCIHACMHACMCMYAYIYIERERVSERSTYVYAHQCNYTYRVPLWACVGTVVVY